MLLGYFYYKGFKGTIEFNYDDWSTGGYTGRVLDINDEVTYSANEASELYVSFCEAVDNQIKEKGLLEL